MLCPSGVLTKTAVGSSAPAAVRLPDRLRLHEALQEGQGEEEEHPEGEEPPRQGHLDGCRIGFDLGGSDRKCAAVIDGKVVHSEEVAWNPYFWIE